jgi:hypothetical protein
MPKKRKVIFSIIDCTISSDGKKACIYEFQPLSKSVITPSSNGVCKATRNRLGLQLYQKLSGVQDIFVEYSSSEFFYDPARAGQSLDRTTLFMQAQPELPMSTEGESDRSEIYEIQEPNILYHKIFQKMWLSYKEPELTANFLIIKTVCDKVKLKAKINCFYLGSSSNSFVLKAPNTYRGEGNTFFYNMMSADELFEQINQVILRCEALWLWLEECINYTEAGQPTQVYRLAHATLYDEHDNLVKTNLVHQDTYISKMGDYDSHQPTGRINHLEHRRYDFAEQTQVSLRHVPLRPRQKSVFSGKLNALMASFFNRESHHAIQSPENNNKFFSSPEMLRELINDEGLSRQPYIPAARPVLSHFPLINKNHTPTDFADQCQALFCRPAQTIQGKISLASNPSRALQNLRSKISPRSYIVTPVCHQHKLEAIGIVWHHLQILITPDGTDALWASCLKAINGASRLRIRKRIWKALIKNHEQYKKGSWFFKLSKNNLIDWFKIDKPNL